MKKRTKLKDRKLPKYSKGEEIFNMVSHIVGGGFSIIAFITCLVVSIIHKSGYAIVSSLIYGFSQILLYTTSAIYHGLSPKLMGKRVFQVLDHCVIYIMIAGCYTPFALVTFRQYDPTLGWGIFGTVWAIAIFGVTMNSIDLKKYRVISMICYLVMGWLIIFKIDLLLQLIGPVGMGLLLAGGIVYTIGVILYGVGVKVKWMHSIFHIFIVIASILQFLSIILFVI